MANTFHDMTDLQLLKRFQQDDDPEVFREIVQRHHGMLLGVAKRLVGCRHSAEDVVQATFLVLAKDARRIRQSGSLSSWLYGVAFRIATRLLRKRSRQSLQAMEGLTEPQDEAMVHDDPLERLSDQFEQATVLEELAALPAKVRAPLIMRYLQGKSNSQVAEEMKLSIAALEGRLKRGRNQLRFRLARQGITLSMGVGILGFVQDEAFAAESPDLVSELVDTCCAGGTNHSKQLAEQEMTSMLTRQIASSVCGIVATVAVVAAGIGLTSGAMTFAQGNDLSGFGGTESTDADPFGSSEIEPTAGDPSKTTVAETNPFAVAASQTTATRQRSGKKTPWQRLEALGYYGLGSDTAEELKILEALAQPTKFEFYDAPISEVMAVVQNVTAFRSFRYSCHGRERSRPELRHHHAGCQGHQFTERA